MKQLSSNKTRFPRFDKILIIYPVAEVYGESNEQQLCSEIAVTRDYSVDSVPTSNLVCIKEVPIGTTFSHMINIAGIIYYT